MIYKSHMTHGRAHYRKSNKCGYTPPALPTYNQPCKACRTRQCFVSVFKEMFQVPIVNLFILVRLGLKSLQSEYYLFEKHRLLYDEYYIKCLLYNEYHMKYLFCNDHYKQCVLLRIIFRLGRMPIW